MNQSSDLSSLLPALCVARAAMPAIIKNCTAHVRSAKGDYSFDYADLGAILEAVVPSLSAQGLLLTFGLTEPSEGRLEVSARLWHCTSGQYLDNALSAPKPETLSATGSLITYLKRYTCTALLGVSAEADDNASADEGHAIAVATKAPQDKAATNGHTPQTDTLVHPTEAHLAALANLALTECHEDKEVYYQRIRQTMGLKPHASVAPRLLTRTMSMVHYMELFTYYQKLAEQLARKTPEVSHGSVSAPKTTPEPTPATAAEDTPAVPPAAAGSSSAGENGHVDTTVDPAYHKLYQEALGWGIAEPEIQHILTHHRDLTKCRTLLWKARRNEPPPVWEKVPAA